MGKSKSAIDMTARWLERLKPPETGRVEHFDEKVHGLGLRVSSTGHKSWFVMYRLKGDSKLKRLTLEPYPQMSLADARERAQAALLDIAKGGDPAGKKRIEKEAPTFEELAAEYIERYAKRAKRSWESDEAMLKKYLLPRWGYRKAHDIQRRDVINLLDDARDAGLTTQVNRILALARKIFNWAIERDLLQYNPCAHAKTNIPEKQRERVLSEDEVRSVWQAFDSLDQVMSTMFKLRLMTAQRGGEVACMRWADVDLTTAWWTIPAEVAKNGLSHRVPLSTPAMSLLMELHAKTGNQDWVFPSPTRKGKFVANIQKAVGRVRKACGVDFVMHDLRRTAASYMTGMRIDRLVVSKVLNHVESGVTKVYDRHSYDAEKREALEAWGERLNAILSSGGRA